MRTIAILVGALSLSGSAFAADMATKMPVKAPPAASPVHSWTGFYGGFDGGYGWGGGGVAFTPNDVLANDVTCGGAFGSGSTCPPPTSVGITGAFGGLQVGYNWQFNQSTLIGIETDLDSARIRGAGTSSFPLFAATAPGTSSFAPQQDVDWFGTLRARLGWLPSDNLLLYATGGFAYGHVDDNVALDVNPGIGGAATGGFGFSCTSPGVNCFSGSTSRTVTGWTAGSGLEYALAADISVKAEYLYVRLGGQAVNVAASTATLNPALMPSSFTAAFDKAYFQVIRVGLNFRFGRSMPAK